MNDEVIVILNGRPFFGWKKVEISRAFEDATGEASLEISEQPGVPKPAKLGDTVQIVIGGEPVITGHVHDVNISTEWGGHTISLKIRDKTQDLIDSTIGPKLKVKLPATLKQVAQKTVKTMGLGIGVIDELGAPPFKKGEAVDGALDTRGFAFLNRWAQKRQAILNTDGKGNLVITQNLSKMAAGYLIHEENNPLNNVKRMSFSNSDKDRHNTHAAASQKSPTDKDYWEGKAKGFQGGQAAEMSKRWAMAHDTAIRPERRLHYRAKEAAEGQTPDKMTKWHANTARTRGMSYTATVQGFRMPGGMLWAPGYLIPVLDHHCDLDMVMFIKSVKWTKDWDGGALTEVTCGPDDSYKPEAAEAKTSSKRVGKDGAGTPAKGTHPPALTIGTGSPQSIPLPGGGGYTKF